ncbi:Chromatin assembly factor 1 subunit B [Sarcoptes scabiei]|uniref:Chromatin assembly factor 1 subunit B n=1 Tax=Sarcoptes scabiei TaxID=52283 RepID=A0A834VAG3_SARSC|nr:Chromatin assembly factor 1 subunit B [Sarcoptes scabiei]
MKVHTPQISWHGRQPILSADIQNRILRNDNSLVNYRLATGGNDSHVIIWKLSLDSNDPLSKVHVECLAELTKHQRSVNVVRFSPNQNENLLASGDDDSLIFIWKYIESDETSSATLKSKLIDLNEESNRDQAKDETRKSGSENFIDSDIITIETWKTHKILRGHSQDVSDLCWSHDGQHLVSGSVDNNVFVWDVQKGCKLHRVAKEHSNYVQGVSWDPLNKFIASLSADRNMIIFKSKNGKTLHKISRMSLPSKTILTNGSNRSEQQQSSTKLFYDQTMMSFFRRLSFSPGGEILLAPSGIIELENEKFLNVVHIFERKSLNRPSFYLPTSKFSVAVKCCPKLFELFPDEDNLLDIPYRIVFAVATENSVLFYDSQNLLPFAYVSQLHYLRLTDISWSPDSRMLMITSTDGFSSFVIFDANELGNEYHGPMMNFEESDAMLLSAKTSNKSSNSSNSCTNESGSINKFTPSPVVNEKEKSKLSSISSSKIMEFFRKSTNSPTESKSESLTSESSPRSTKLSKSNQNIKVGRRVSLITLFDPKKSQTSSNTSGVDVSPESKMDIESLPTLPTGIKRKQSDDSITEEC